MPKSELTYLSTSPCRKYELHAVNAHLENGFVWRSFKVVRVDGRGRKKNWWLRWNGERTARSRDAKLLSIKKIVHAWAVDAMRAAKPPPAD